MTVVSEIVDDIVVSESKMGLGDYVSLPQSDDPEVGRLEQAPCSSSWWRSWRWWLKVALLCLFLAALAALFLIFLGPLLLDKVHHLVFDLI